MIANLYERQKMIKENIYRNKTCAELRIENAGEEVRLAGWVDTIRKLGGITFLTLRDHYGITDRKSVV